MSGKIEIEIGSEDLTFRRTNKEKQSQNTCGKKRIKRMTVWNKTHLKVKVCYHVLWMMLHEGKKHGNA